MLTLAESLQAANQPNEALQVLATAMERLESGLSPDADLVVAVVSAVLDARYAADGSAAADQIFRISAARLAEHAGREHPSELFRESALQLAELLVAEHRWEEAALLLDEARAALQRANIRDDEFDVATTLLLAQVLRGQSHHDAAERVLRHTLQQVPRWPRDAWREAHLDLVQALGELLMGLARYADAATLYQQAIADDPALTESLQPLAARAAAAAHHHL